MTADTQSHIIPSSTESTLANIQPLVERARSYASDARSEATRRAYTADWRAFESWTTSRSIPCQPATQAAVATYLAWLADQGRKVSTIERALAGIANTHRVMGFEWQKGAPAIREVMAGIRRRLGCAQEQKAPVTDDVLARLVSTLEDNLSGIRDRALLSLGWMSAVRRSELVALEMSDVAFVTAGLVVTLRRSKTDQQGRGREIGIPYAGSLDVCPVRSVKAWLEAAGINGGAIFRAVDRHGNLGDIALTDRTVARIIQRCAEAAGLDPSQFAGHSLRAGFATTAASKGKGLDAIMRQTGHKSERIARRYIRHGTLFTDNAGAGIL